MPTNGSGTAAGRLEGPIQIEAPIIVGATEGKDGAKSSFLDGDIRQLRVLDRAVTETEARLLASWGELAASPAPGGRSSQRWGNAMLSIGITWSATTRPLRTRPPNCKPCKKSCVGWSAGSGQTLVMAEKPDSEPMAHVLHRGMYDQQREQVGPSTPSFLPPMPGSFPRNRLGLARMAGR